MGEMESNYHPDTRALYKAKIRVFNKSLVVIEYGKKRKKKY